jgi:putative serine/threonine protein kinase
VIALKIRRTDADRASMENEAKLQKIANGAGAGPRYLCHTENLIAMEFVPGKSVIKWIESASAPQFRNVARNVLEQCFCLDQAGIDHGELSRLGRHVIVSEKDSPYIIDFESASTGRKTINVSSATQSLFLYGAVAAKAGKLLSVSEQDAVIEKIREYKHRRDRPAFERLVESLEI